MSKDVLGEQGVKGEHWHITGADSGPSLAKEIIGVKVTLTNTGRLASLEPPRASARQCHAWPVVGTLQALDRKQSLQG